VRSHWGTCIVETGSLLRHVARGVSARWTNSNPGAPAHVATAPSRGDVALAAPGVSRSNSPCAAGDRSSRSRRRRDGGGDSLAGWASLLLH
jgi:hypothetical protein